MSLGLFVSPVWQFFDNNGNPAVNWQLATYAAGTVTPLATYQDPGQVTPNNNPIVMNSRGEATIYLQNALYKFIFSDNLGNVIWTNDQVAGLNYGTIQSGYLLRSVAGNTDVSLSFAEYSSNVIELTGIITGNINVIVPMGINGYRWVVKNSTTGAFTVTFKTLSGTGVVVTRGATYQIFTDGVNAYRAIGNTIESGNLTASATRPADVVSGGYWINSTYDTNKWGVYRYDGTDDILEGVVNTSTNQYFPVNGLDYATITPGADADVTLTALQYKAGRLVLANGSWTAGHNIIVPTDRRLYFIDNTAGSYTATVKTASGTGIAVTTGVSRILVCDGVNVVDPLSAYTTSAYVASFNSRTGAVTLTSADVASTDGSATAGTNYVCVTDFQYNVAIPPAGSLTTSYVEQVNIRIIRAGTYQTSLVYLSDGTHTVYVRIYKNGAAFGTERTTTSSSPQTSLESLAFAAGDSMQIFMKTSLNGSAGTLLRAKLGTADNPRLPQFSMMSIGDR